MSKPSELQVCGTCHFDNYPELNKTRGRGCLFEGAGHFWFKACENYKSKHEVRKMLDEMLAYLKTKTANSGKSP